MDYSGLIVAVLIGILVAWGWQAGRKKLNLTIKGKHWWAIVVIVESEAARERVEDPGCPRPPRPRDDSGRLGSSRGDGALGDQPGGHAQPGRREAQGRAACARSPGEGGDRGVSPPCRGVDRGVVPPGVNRGRPSGLTGVA